MAKRTARNRSNTRLTIASTRRISIELSRAPAPTEGPDEIGDARAKTNRPGRPESAAAILRQQTTPNHFGINRPGRPRHRPAQNVTVCQGAKRHRFTRTESALRMPAMSERIERLFARCRGENRAAFI